MINKLFLLLAVICCENVYTQDLDSPEINEVLSRSKTPCQTRNNGQGYCLTTDTCRRILPHVRRFRNPSVCYYRQQVAHICCPVRLRQNNPANSGPAVSHPSNSVPVRPPARPPQSFANQPSSSTKLDINPPGCGQRIYGPTPGSDPVVGGQEATKYSWPWMVAIREKSFDSYTRFQCGGSLITPRHVLSAAHCFDSLMKGDRSAKDYKVVLGSHYRENDNSDSSQEEEGTIALTPSNIKVHEGFNSQINDNDVAVITLENDAPMTDRIRPVCLPTRSRRPTTNLVTVIGWGDTSFIDGRGSKTLQEATFSTVRFQRCRHLFRNIPSVTITESMLCAGDLSGKKDSCQHDSGGPLVSHNEEDNTWTQVGIVSFGLNCAEKGFPGVYSRLVHLIPWIRRQIRS